MIVLALEAIGHDRRDLPFGLGPRAPWVAAITGRDPRFGLAREFLRPEHTDYARANAVGSRGVCLIYHLAPGVYEVAARESWQSTRRYFLRVHPGGRTEEIDRALVDAWLDGVPLDPPAYYVP